MKVCGIEKEIIALAVLALVVGVCFKAGIDLGDHIIKDEPVKYYICLSESGEYNCKEEHDESD